ncbi:hypothetical protein [Devosia aurantiaca]|uniref:Uncharacterized protein n=1 Tax=Devosia aurantiaca TaxID=2714858 RepID=A0A6M1T0M0_9HYPH|nr:hypothetical protein [Devosia aurantiaca]NGP18431.1 hypothetical protein [Devosia aurantiaca]
MDGFYAVYYTGQIGFGHAVLVLREGTIAGADVVGGVYDGFYKSEPDNTIMVDIILTVPAGTTLVTGQTLTAPHSQNIKANVAATFANGQTVALNTPLAQ